MFNVLLIIWDSNIMHPDPPPTPTVITPTKKNQVHFMLFIYSLEQFKLLVAGPPSPKERCIFSHLHTGQKPSTVESHPDADEGLG